MLQGTCSSLAMGTIASLNLSVMEMKMLPLAGSFCPAAVAALAYALAKLVSMPITSPVDLISGPSSVSAPAQNGKRATCTAKLDIDLVADSFQVCSIAELFSKGSWDDGQLQGVSPS